MASVDQFEIEIWGGRPCGRAASDHRSGARRAHIVTALQSLVFAAARSAGGSVSLGWTEVHAGRAFNVIPDRADLRGTVRHVRGPLLRGCAAAGRGDGAGHRGGARAQANVDYRRLSAPSLIMKS